MKTVMSVLAIVALVAVVGFTVQPASASDLAVNVAKVIVTGGPQGGVISIWQASGGAPLANGSPTGQLESATPIAMTGLTEVFVPFDDVSNVFLWTSDHGYRLLSAVAPSARGEVITISAQ